MAGPARRKQFVDVYAFHDIDGNTQPQQIVLKDGQFFDVEEVKKVVKVSTVSQFKTASRYTVVIKGKETFLFEEYGKWFVLMKS